MKSSEVSPVEFSPESGGEYQLPIASRLSRRINSSFLTYLTSEVRSCMLGASDFFSVTSRQSLVVSPVGISPESEGGQ